MRPKRSTAARTAASASARLVVAGGQGGFDEIDAHATAGSSDEPDLPVSHGIIDTQPNLHHLTKLNRLAYICTNVGPTSQVILANSQGFRTGKMDSLKISSESGMHQLSRKKDLPPDELRTVLQAADLRLRHLLH